MSNEAVRSAHAASRVLHALVRLDAWAHGWPLLQAQAATCDDLVRLDGFGHIEARLCGTVARLPLAEHFRHDGSPRVLEVRTTGAGRRTVATPTGRVLSVLSVRPGMSATAARVIRDADVDTSWLASIAGHGHVTLHSLTGELLDFGAAYRLPVKSFTVAVTPRGRRYLPNVPLI